MDRLALVICDVWDTHWCVDIRQRADVLAERLDAFAKVVRQYGGLVVHSPSDTVDTHYAGWEQRQRAAAYPRGKLDAVVEMRPVVTPLVVQMTGGCPDMPLCRPRACWTKQHEAIEILPEDVISDSGQEIYNMVAHEEIGCILLAGQSLNMCVLGRPFGVLSLRAMGVPLRVVHDLTELAYAPVEPPHITMEQARWLVLGYLEAKWCPVTSTAIERQRMEIGSRSEMLEDRES
jgi:hypothetical protein